MSTSKAMRERARIPRPRTSPAMLDGEWATAHWKMGGNRPAPNHEESRHGEASAR
jgi:hypothetical protein